MQEVVVLGSTGSIGTQTLDILTHMGATHQVVGIACASRWERLVEQCLVHRPKFVAIADELAAERFLIERPDAIADIEVFQGEHSSDAIVRNVNCDVVVCAMAGIAGLLPFLSALRLGRRVLLSNKEAIVAGGELFAQSMGNGSAIIPLDSEHNAAFQMLKDADIHHYPLVTESMGIDKLILTASGGPFWGQPVHSLTEITKKEATDHPNWSMGAKNSLDSATLMNKALELIEAHYLFGLLPENIDVLVHRQSQMHALWVYKDGNASAVLSPPDMKVHIGHALHYPNRFKRAFAPWSLSHNLTFEPLREDFFQSVSLAKAALRSGGTAPALLNTLNEAAGAAFLQEQCRFTDVVELIERGLNAIPSEPVKDIDTLFDVDTRARRWIHENLR